MPEVEETVKAFRSLFIGRTDAWGAVGGKSTKEEVTEDYYKRHLEKKVSLGIYPILDDNTVRFFVVDLDERDWSKALAIRQGFLDLGVHAYISLSRRKGYHIWVFGSEPIPAKAARALAHGILRKLDLECEVFPKQDQLDEVTPLGNYINLPCFGALSTIPERHFLNNKQKMVSLIDALPKIQRVSKQAIEDASQQVPPPVTPRIIPTTTKKRGGKSQYPPCIDGIMKGTVAGARDVAAFALARHLLDQLYTPDEVLGLLIAWDGHNNPPFNDMRLLETKVKSAVTKGYAFGCSSIKDEPLLSHLCVGEQSCPWLRNITKDRKKKGLIREQSFHETEMHYYEEIVKEGSASFVTYDKATGQIGYVSSIDQGGVSIVPIHSDEIIYGAVTLPTDIAEYGSTLELVEEIKAYIKDYVDFPKDIIVEFCTWYIIMTWVFDKLSTLSYLRFIGDTGTGKSRCLDVIGKLSYKPIMMAGAVTPAPIYRLVRRFRGTIILEEADFRDSTEKSEVVTILNSGFERFRPVIRCTKDDPDRLEVLPIFGPKIFATRFEFTDIALEARCLTFTMEETDREDIPPLLGDKFYDRCMGLRNKLLLWRLRNLQNINPGAVEDIDLGKLEPRLKQIGLPFAVPFKDYPDVLERFKKFMFEYAVDLKKDRSDSIGGKIINALFRLAMDHGKMYVSSGLIAGLLNEEYKVDIKPGQVGKHLKSMHCHTSNRRAPEGRSRYLDWDEKLMKKLMRRYIPEPEDFDRLFLEEPGEETEVTETEDKVPDMEV